MKVVHCKKARYDVYIGRPSKWGNPFEIGKDGTREEVILKYQTYLLSQPSLLEGLPALIGKTLGCWCSPKPCHGDVLVTLTKSIVECPNCKNYLFIVNPNYTLGDTIEAKHWLSINPKVTDPIPGYPTQCDICGENIYDALSESYRRLKVNG